MVLDDDVSNDPELRGLHDDLLRLTAQVVLWIAALATGFVVLMMLLWPAAANAAPPCLPTITGEPVGQVGIKRNSLGWHGHFFCLERDAAGAVSKVHGVTWHCLHAQCMPDLFTRNYAEAQTATDPAATARAKWDASFKDTCSAASAGSNTALLCTIARYHMCEAWPTANAPKPAICAGIVLPPIPPPVLPSPGTFVVAPTSICATIDKEGGVCVRRQSFTWDGAARGTVAQAERATIGAPCITTFGVAPYFGFDATRTDRVVQCVKK